MRRKLALAFIASSIASAIACVDLFHSTSDVKSICENDASDSRCDAGSTEAGPVDLCAPEAGVAQSRAVHACAWLAACGHPIGENKTGACMVDAILAYDCAANPNRKAKGTALTFWNCMQNANDCGAVEKCLFPQAGSVTCTTGGFLGCVGQNIDTATRVDCVQASSISGGENCAAHGQTCDAIEPDGSNRNALCVGAQGRACTGVGCSNGGLTLCDDAGVDIGYACSTVGAGACFLSGASAACKPESTGTCPATNDVTCTSGSVQAKGCVTGLPEVVDCTAISGAGTCVPIEGGAPGVVPAAACHVDDGGCADDTCSGAKLVACVRGRAVTVDCAALGLKGCNPIATSESQTAYPACNPP